jgi:hypothetical protein
MEEKEATMKDSIEYILKNLLHSKHGDGNHTNIVDASIEFFPSPEEGVHLIRAFVRIKQPELRAAIIKLTTQIADVRALTMPVQN